MAVFGNDIIVNEREISSITEFVITAHTETVVGSSITDTVVLSIAIVATAYQEHAL